MVIRRPTLPAAVLSQGEGQGEGRRRHRTDGGRDAHLAVLPSITFRNACVQVSVIDQLQHRCPLSAASSASPLQPCVRSTLRLETQFIGGSLLCVLGLTGLAAAV